MTSTFDSNFAAALDDLFHELGEDATYYTGGGETLSVTVIAGPLGEDARERTSEAPYERDTRRIRVVIRTSELTTPTREDTLLYGGIVWAVALTPDWCSSTVTEHRITFETEEWTR